MKKQIDKMAKQPKNMMSSAVLAFLREEDVDEPEVGDENFVAKVCVSECFFAIFTPGRHRQIWKIALGTAVTLTVLSKTV